MPKKKGELSIEERLEQSIVAKEEMPYKLPSNWVWTRLGDIIYQIRGVSYKPNNILTSKDGIRILRGGNIQDGKLILENDDVFIEKEIIKQEQLVKKGDIVITASTGSIKAIGKNTYIKNDILNTAFGAFLKVVRSNKNINSDLLGHFFQTRNYKKYIEDNVQGVNINNIKNEHIDSILFPLPPLEEQKRIVEKLDSLFEKIQKIKEIIEEVKEKTTSRREAILSKAFSGELTEKWRGENHSENARELLVKINDEKLKLWEDECKKAEDEGRKKPAKPKLKTIDEMLVGAEEEPYKLPNNWVWTRLGDITDINMGQSPKGESVSKDFSENSFGLIGGPSDMGKDFPMISRYTTSPTKFSEKEEIILSVRATLGKTVFSDGIYCLGRGVCSLKSKVIDKNILRFYLTNITEYLYSIGTGSTFLQISRNDIENLLFPLPPLEEQKEIVRVLDRVFEEENRISELISLENKIEILEKTILDRAFRGELGTGNNNDEPAIELLRRCLEER